MNKPYSHTSAAQHSAEAPLALRQNVGTVNDLKFFLPIKVILL